MRADAEVEDSYFGIANDTDGFTIEYFGDGEIHIYHQDVGGSVIDINIPEFHLSPLGIKELAEESF